MNDTDPYGILTPEEVREARAKGAAVARRTRDNPCVDPPMTAWEQRRWASTEIQIKSALAALFDEDDNVKAFPKGGAS